MKTIVIEADDQIYKEIVKFLRNYPNDKVEFYNDPSDTMFTEENRKQYQKALNELEQGETISLQDLKREKYNV